MKTNKDLCFELINKRGFELCFENAEAICISRQTKSPYPNDNTIYADILTLDLIGNSFYGVKDNDLFFDCDGLDIAEAFGLA